MRLAMHPLSGSRVRRIDEAEIGAALVVEPIGHVLDPVSLLDFEVFAVRLGDAFGGHAGHVVAIHKDWHESLLLPFACAAQEIWSDVLVRCSQPAIGEPKDPSRRERRGGCLSAAARPSESSITRRRASV